MDRRLDELTRDEATRLLATASVGRVGITVGALPVIVPVNYAVMDDVIVFRPGPGPKLAAAVQGAVVAFEADESDLRSRTAWSVLVVGYARQIMDRARLDRARSLDLQSWLPGDGDVLTEIQMEIVSGRRITGPAGDLPRDR